MAAAVLKITNVSLAPVNVPGGPLAPAASRDLELDLILRTTYYQTELAALVPATITVEFQGQALTSQQIIDLELTISKFGMESFQNTHLYADGTTGNDNNDGLTVGTPKKTLRAVWDLMPAVVKHEYRIHLSGKFASVPAEDYYVEMRDNASVVLDGGSGLTVVYDNAGSPWVSDVATVDTIGLSTLGWTVDAHLGWMVEMVTGAAAGDVRTIKSNTAGVLTVTKPFTAAPSAGDTFHIVRPTTEIEQVDVPFTVFTKGMFSRTGSGTLRFQRLTLSGNAPLAYRSTGEAWSEFCVSSCVINKQDPTLTLGVIFRVLVMFAQGGVYFNAAPVDPDVFTPTFLPSAAHAGVGSVGSVYFYDLLIERTQAILEIDGCAFQTISGIDCRIFWTITDTIAKQLTLVSGTVPPGPSASNIGEGCVFGGYVPAFYPGPPNPAVYVVSCDPVFNGTALKPCIIGNGSPYGVFAIASGIQFRGVVQGTALVAGVYAREAVVIFMAPGMTMTLTGTALGDLTFDNAIPVPGGWAGILAGAPVTDPNMLSRARVGLYDGSTAPVLQL